MPDADSGWGSSGGQNDCPGRSPTKLEPVGKPNAQAEQCRWIPSYKRHHRQHPQEKTIQEIRHLILLLSSSDSDSSTSTVEKKKQKKKRRKLAPQPTASIAVAEATLSRSSSADTSETSGSSSGSSEQEKVKEKKKVKRGVSASGKADDSGSEDENFRNSAVTKIDASDLWERVRDSGDSITFLSRSFSFVDLNLFFFFEFQ